MPVDAAKPSAGLLGTCMNGVALLNGLHDLQMGLEKFEHNVSCKALG